jgi:hypothetical protein
MNRVYNQSLFCESMVDQNRYVGTDPIGYACARTAKYELEDGCLVCEECMRMLKEERDRITLPKVPLGREGQKDFFEKRLKEMLEIRLKE